MAKIWVGPTGKIVKGSVLDVARKGLEEKLKDYDSQLYVKWNPRKMGGNGCWEVRRRPNTMSVVEVFVWEGNTYSKIDYDELDIVNHVVDMWSLNYSVLDWLKTKDTWKQKNYGAELEAKELAHRQDAAIKSQENMLYAAKQFKREIREYRELLASGMNPAEIARHWK